MSKLRVHWPHTNADFASNLWTLCGRAAHDADHLAAEVAQVTCRGCQKRLALVEPPPPPFEPELLERARRGAHTLDDYGRRAIEDSKRAPSDGVRPWARSAEAAVKRYVRVHDEGAALRSTCDPSRANRVQTSSDPSLGGREHAAVEQVATVARALDAAEQLPMLISEACPCVTPRQARQLYLLLLVGRERAQPTRPGHHRQHRERVTMGALDLVEHVRIDHGLRLCHADRADCGVAGQDSCDAIAVHNIQKLRRLFTRVVEVALLESGEMEPRRPREGRRGWSPLGRVKGTNG